MRWTWGDAREIGRHSRATRLDGKGNVIGWATEPAGSPTFCHAIAVEKLVTRPDYLHPMLVRYVHGILEGRMTFHQQRSGVRGAGGVLGAHRRAAA